MRFRHEFNLWGLFLVAGALCFAESWTGRLIDATCHDQAQGKAAACTPTAKTTSFAIETNDGKVMKLDSAGNAKAARVVKTSAKPDADVTVSGSMSGETVKVDSLVAQP